MAYMLDDFQDSASHNAVDRLSYVVGGSLLSIRLMRGEDSSLVRRAMGIANAVLAVGGSAYLLAKGRRRWIRKRQLLPELFLLVTAGAYIGGISAGLDLPVPRYIVPTMIIGSLLSAVGLAAGIRKIASITIAWGPRFASLLMPVSAPDPARATATLLLPDRSFDGEYKYTKPPGAE
jgi:hypothetical protein